MKWSQITDVGRVRSANEDSMIALPDMGLFGVADGMGGHKAGEIASSTALSYLGENLPGYLEKEGNHGDSLLRVLQEANLRIFRLSTEFNEYRGMGTTVTVGFVAGQELMVAHIGDSRAYQLRNDTLVQITDDHSLVAEMVRGGGITEEQALTHPQRNVLTRALGTAPTVVIDLYRVNLLPGDRILFCTDGLSNHLTPEEIRTIIQTTNDLEQALLRLMDMALERGGTDNITMVLLEID